MSHDLYSIRRSIELLSCRVGDATWCIYYYVVNVHVVVV